MAISAGDLVNMRTGNQRVIPHLNVVPKVVLGTCRINQTYFFYPTNTFNLDGDSWNGGITGSGDLTLVGRQVWIGTTAGAHDVMTSSVASGGVNGQLYLTGFGEGDPGVAVQEAVALADDQYVTVLANRPLWAQLSRINAGVFYKAFNRTYVDQGSAPDPVSNVGPWRRIVLSGASVSATFTNAAIADVKPAGFAWSGALAAFSWEFRNESWAQNTGGSFTGGIDNTETVQIDFDTAGFYVVSCTVTDANLNTHTAETYVWVVDGSTEADLTGWRVESDTQDRVGRRMTIRMYGDVAESVVYPGAGFLYTETQTFNDATLTAGATVDTFVGYIDMEKRIRQVGFGMVEFDLIGPSLLLDKLSMAPQYIQEATSPADWTEVSILLSNPNGVVWYILQHHAPNMLIMHDFWRLIFPVTGTADNDLRDKNWILNAQSVWGQIKEVQPQLINAGCDSSGGLLLRHDPQLMSDTDRNALDSRMTWTAADIREPLEYPAVFRLEVGQVDAYAFMYSVVAVSATAYWSRAPGDAQAPGTRKETIDGLIVSSTGGQSRLNTIAGHLFAKFNNPTPALVLHAMRNMDTADPARMVWHALTISAALDPRHDGYTAQRLLPTQVTRTWEDVDGTWVKRIDITVEVETKGIAGIYKPVPVATDAQWYPVDAWPQLGDYPALEPPANPASPTRLIAAAGGGTAVARTMTTDILTGNPVWEDISTGLTGIVYWLTADPWAYNRYFAATATGVFRCENVWGSAPVWQLILDVSPLPAAGQAYGYHFIAMSILRQGWIAVCHNINTVLVSFDYGDTWTTTWAYGTTPEQAYNLWPGFNGNIQAVPWYNATLDPYNVVFHVVGGVYASNDWGLTWSLLSNLPTEYSGGAVAMPFMRTDVIANVGTDSARIIWVQGGSDGGVADKFPMYKSIDSGANFVVNFAGSGAGDWTGASSGSMRVLVPYTQDGRQLFAVQQQISSGTGDFLTRIAYSEDAGATWTATPTAVSAGTRITWPGINGWPYDPNTVLFWYNKTIGGIIGGELNLSFDRGTTWIDMLGNLLTDAIFPDARINYAELGLASVQGG